MNIKEARQVSQDNLEPQVIDLSPIDFGGDSEAFKIVTDGGNFILRSGGKRNNYDVEDAVLKLLIQRGAMVPIPVVDNIDFNNPKLSFSIQEELPGNDLYRSELPQGEWPKIIKSVGRNLRIINSLKLSGFGPISTDKFRSQKKLVGSFDSYYDFIRYYFDSRVDILTQKVDRDVKEDFTRSNLTKEQIEKVLEVVSKVPEAKKRMTDYFLEFKTEGSFVHGDFHTQHVLVDNGRLTGIIDLNNTLIAEPLFDIAYWSIMPKGILYRELAKSAGIKIDEERFKLYRMLISIAKLHTRYVSNDYLNKFPEILDFALGELNK